MDPNVENDLGFSVDTFATDWTDAKLLPLIVDLPESSGGLQWETEFVQEN
jgi:hypothetical protein